MSVVINLSLATFLIGFVSSLISAFFEAKVWPRLGLFNLVLGWLGLSVFLITRWQAAGRAPLSNQYESLIFLLWAVLAIYFLFVSLALAEPFPLRSKDAGRPEAGRFPQVSALENLAPWVAGFVLMGMGVAALLNPTIEPLVPALQSNWLLIHVATTLLGYGALSLAFLGGLVYLLGRWFALDGPGKSQLDEFLYKTSALGFWLLTLGIITGAVWANSAWGSYWSWDPKETWALVTWIFYAIAIHLRRTRGWRGKSFAWLSVAGFAFVVFTYFGVNYLLSGLHAYA